MTTDIVTDAYTLTAEQAELQARARAFVEEVLMPLEVEAERARGRLPAERIAEIRHAAIDRRLGGGLHAVEHGGQGWSHTEWVLVEEQLGRATNALSWHMPGAYNVLAHGTPAQIDRYLKPALRGRRAPLLEGGEAQVAGALVGVLERLLEQGVARGEVVVHEPGGDARLGGDARDAHVVDPLARDEPDGGVQQPLASLRSHLATDGLHPNSRHP